MMQRVLFCLALILLPSLGAACPDYMAEPVNRQVATGRDLWSPEVFLTRAGGRSQIAACGFARRGYVGTRPDFEFDLSRMSRYDRLHVRANADCDTVLLLRDARGRWFFDDDSGTGRTASLSIADPPDGRYFIWVGSYRQQGCDARLTLETF